MFAYRAIGAHLCWGCSQPSGNRDAGYIWFAYTLPARAPDSWPIQSRGIVKAERATSWPVTVTYRQLVLLGGVILWKERCVHVYHRREPRKYYMVTKPESIWHTWRVSSVRIKSAEPRKTVAMQKQKFTARRKGQLSPQQAVSERTGVTLDISISTPPFFIPLYQMTTSFPDG